MDVGGGKGGPKSDINVTPLVDVMLVLLIIMMLVAPLLQQGVSLKLPLAANTSEKPETSDQTVVAITPDKQVYINSLPVQSGDLRRRIQEIMDAKSGEKIVIDARRAKDNSKLDPQVLPGARIFVPRKSPFGR